MTVELKAKAKKKHQFILDIRDPPQEFDAKGESKLMTRLHDMLSVP